MQTKAKQSALLLHVTLLGLMCLGIAFVFGFSSAHAPGYAPTELASSRGGAHFVFADLDGDRNPDMALVEMQSQRSADADYSIHVRLSAGAESAIGVDGPLGGLRLAARDVNGDDNLDLIVTSNLDANFVEVLLNDGHGNFRMARSDEVSQLEDQTDRVLRAPASSQIDRASLESVRSSLEMEIVAANDFDQVFSSDAELPAVIGHTLQGTPGLRVGRSPPVPVL
jgi:hypothetical protein